MKVKVLSSETIMPSSPTPPHLKTFQLSLVDQLSPVLYVPLIFFYPMEKIDDIGHHNSQKEIIATIKSSLSETLSRFFLLAGRIVDKSISCSDEGAIFIETSVSCNMFEILKEPNNEVLMKLAPCSVVCNEPVEEYAQVIVQANIFSCGRIAISLCLLHKLMDGTTFSSFLRSWASSNKEYFSDSSPKMVCSDYNALSSLFPQSNSFPFHPQVQNSTFSSSDKTCRLQRFVFERKAILDLKAKAKSIDVPNPTCVEAITGFIWKHAMKASSTRIGSQRPSTLCHVVNLRNRMQPPLPEVSVGNILWATFSHYNSSNEIENDHDHQVELSELVGLLRHSFAKINNEYIQGFMGDDDNDEGINSAFSKLLGEFNVFSSEVSNNYFCTSWRNMKLNEVDFGWGKPLWICIAGNLNEMLKNVVVLSDTVFGDGVEAWMLLDQKEIQLLEQNPQFLEFALLNPSII